VGALRKKGKSSRWKESPGAPAPGFFGGWEKKGGRGMKKEGASSKIRRKETWEARKLRRARAPLLPEKGGRAGGAAGPVSASR
jgi:hypothetical protein